MRPLAGTLLPIAGLVLACSVEQPTSPSGSGPAADQRPAGPTATVVTTTTVIDQAADVGYYTSLANRDGRQHITYQDVLNKDLKYATCASGCGSASNWTRVVIDQVGSVGHHSSLEVTPDGRRHVTYRDETNQDLKYATCAPAADCSLPASWKKVRVDTQEGTGIASALTVGADGRRYVSYLRRQVGAGGETMALRYATCSSGCAQAANWIRITVDEGPNATAAPEYFLATSIAIGRNGRLHIAYLNAAGSDLRYATCLSNCSSAANWQKVTIDEGGWQIGFHSSLALGPDGAVHVSYWDRGNADLVYARCVFDCVKPWNWKTLRVAETNDVGGYTSLALEASGRVHISYHDFTNSALSYATCNGDCTLPLSWTRAVLDGANQHQVGLFTSLTARDGVVRISYYDSGSGDLKFLTRSPLADPF